jgi:hypothetical protein
LVDCAVPAPHRDPRGDIAERLGEELRLLRFEQRWDTSGVDPDIVECVFENRGIAGL